MPLSQTIIIGFDDLGLGNYPKKAISDFVAQSAIQITIIYFPNRLCSISDHECRAHYRSQLWYWFEVSMAKASHEALKSG